MATELRKLEDTVKEIHSEMLYLRRREEQMRNLNGQLRPPIVHSHMLLAHCA
jgi:TPP-dependent pyruvate/acetoin dehydrogenase alpha subunit